LEKPLAQYLSVVPLCLASFFGGGRVGDIDFIAGVESKILGQVQKQVWC